MASLRSNVTLQIASRLLGDAEKFYPTETLTNYLILRQSYSQSVQGGGVTLEETGSSCRSCVT